MALHVTLTVPFDIRLRREQDRWSFDPRVPADEQTGEEVYRDNPLDRGHLVRRLDPTWRISLAAAKSAGDDTFHFTNRTPQHKDFNQNQTTWAGLEDYLLENADNRDLKASARTPPARGVVQGTRLPGGPVPVLLSAARWNTRQGCRPEHRRTARRARPGKART